MTSGSSRPLRQLFSRVVPPVVGGLAEHIGARTSQLADAVAALALGRPPSLDTLTYHAVIDFFVTHQNGVPDARSGVLVREGHPDGSVVRMFFLDDAGRPLVGGANGGPHRSYLVHTIDDELTELFDGRDLILFT